jgi:hypothetical protein
VRPREHGPHVRGGIAGGQHVQAGTRIGELVGERSQWALRMRGGAGRDDGQREG